MPNTDTWNAAFEAVPADGDLVSEGAERIRDTKLAVRERLAKDHYLDVAGTDADHGEHLKVTLRVGSAPAAVADKGFIYAKDVSTKAELFYRDEDGDEIQLTTGGIINAAGLGANTFTADQTYADFKLIRPEIKDYGETINAIGGTGGGTQDLDLTLGNVQTATVDTGANTFTFSNPSATGIAYGFTFIVTNGGSQTVTWPASVDWVAATVPTLTASGVDVLAFLTRDAGTTWLGFVVGLDVK
jgi:hypothetical protein